jgi:nitric oxide synthase oxygenase domain/subunit
MEMARAIIKAMPIDFNEGRILPTVFVSPPRTPGKRVPMVWNRQILALAGYGQEDGSILGDPAKGDMTQSIIDFGWRPVSKKSRWDLLPLVTMAENDPFIGWFMDAEIGIRNLADTFRYNALPDIANGLQLSDAPHTALQDLPEYMRLVALM